MDGVLTKLLEDVLPVEILSHQQVAIGTHNYDGDAVGSLNKGWPGKMLVLFDVSALGQGADLNVIFYRSDDGVTWTACYPRNSYWLDEIDAAGFYVAELDHPSRYTRVQCVVAHDTVTFGIHVIGTHNPRCPVDLTVAGAAVPLHDVTEYVI